MDSFWPGNCEPGVECNASSSNFQELDGFGEQRDPGRRITYLDPPLLTPRTAIPRLLVAMQNHLAGAIIGSLAWSLVKKRARVVGIRERGALLRFNPK